MILTFTSVFPKTHALIIGVGDYDDDNLGDLPGAVKDAEQLSQMLIRLGIVEKENLILLTNPGYLDLLIQIEEWIEKGGEADQMIFYFGGHSQEGMNADGKTDTYLLPKDVKTKFLDRSAYNFRQEWQERLSQKLKASETLMIFDTCYAGGITKERGLQDLKLRSLEFEKIAEETNVNFLFSSKENQTSKELEEEHGGWYTYYLLEGIQTGAANYNKDLTIDAEEISRYLEERVSASTKGEQTPISILGKRDMTVSRDENILNDRIKLVILEQTLLKTIKRDNSEKYIQILNQKSDQDTPTEAKIRQYLKRYYEDRDVEVLEALTDSVLKDQTPQMEQTEQTDKDLQRQQPSQQEKPEQQPTAPPQRQGTCYLKLTAANEEAKGAQIYIDGEYAGTLETGTILIERLEKATHTITIDGEKIEREEIEITFDNDYMMVTQTIAAQTAKRKLLIITDPPGATLEINGTQQNEKTPVMIEVTIEQEHHIKLTKDGYQEKELTIKEDSKGEPKRIETTLIANKAPNTPILIAPTGNQEETTTELKWHCTDPEGDAIAYEIYIAETGQPLEKETETKATTNAENSYTLTNLKANTQYTWQIIAKDEWRQTKGTIWQFKTKTILTKQIKIETEPPNADI